MPRRTEKSRRGLERANEPAVLILTSLASGTKHGYMLAKDIEGFAGVSLGPGTLYGAIAGLGARRSRNCGARDAHHRRRGSRAAGSRRSRRATYLTQAAATWVVTMKASRF